LVFSYYIPPDCFYGSGDFLFLKYPSTYKPKSGKIAVFYAIYVKKSLDFRVKSYELRVMSSEFRV
jgi:hypothetical protein